MPPPEDPSVEPPTSTKRVRNEDDVDAVGEPEQAAMGSDSAARPADAPSMAELKFASLWYYEDAQGCMQGPFSATDMRSWHLANYLQPTLKVAPSWYGEVPTALWEIAALWSNVSDAFDVVEQAIVAPAVASRGPDFMPSDHFAGRQDGYYFGSGMWGVGYYRDEPLAVEITVADLQEEIRERKAKAARFRATSQVPGPDLGNTSGR